MLLSEKPHHCDNAKAVKASTCARSNLGISTFQLKLHPRSQQGGNSHARAARSIPQILKVSDVQIQRIQDIIDVWLSQFTRLTEPVGPSNTCPVRSQHHILSLSLTHNLHPQQRHHYRTLYRNWQSLYCSQHPSQRLLNTLSIPETRTESALPITHHDLEIRRLPLLRRLRRHRRRARVLALGPRRRHQKGQRHLRLRAQKRRQRNRNLVH